MASTDNVHLTGKYNLGKDGLLISLKELRNSYFDLYGAKRRIRVILGSVLRVTNGKYLNVGQSITLLYYMVHNILEFQIILHINYNILPYNDQTA